MFVRHVSISHFVSVLILLVDDPVTALTTEYCEQTTPIITPASTTEQTTSIAATTSTAELVESDRRESRAEDARAADDTTCQMTG